MRGSEPHPATSASHDQHYSKTSRSPLFRQKRRKPPWLPALTTTRARFWRQLNKEEQQTVCEGSGQGLTAMPPAYTCLSHKVGYDMLSARRPRMYWRGALRSACEPTLSFLAVKFGKPPMHITIERSSFDNSGVSVIYEEYGKDGANLNRKLSHFRQYGL